MIGSDGHCTKSGCGHYWTSHNNYRYTEQKTRYWEEEVESAELVSTLKDLTQGKSKTQGLIDKFKADLLTATTKIGESVINITEINKELDKIALKKQPFSDTTFFDQLIADEKLNKKEGYTQRIESYTAYKKRIELTQKAATGSLNLEQFITLNKEDMDSLNLEELKQLSDSRHRA